MQLDTDLDGVTEDGEDKKRSEARPIKARESGLACDTKIKLDVETKVNGACPYA